MILTPEALKALRGQLIVSCQAYPGEPLRDPRSTAQMAASAVIGSAAAVRVQGLADVQFTRAAVEVPVIGLWQDGHDGVFITPTLRHALAVANAGAHVVAIDGTRRERPDGLTLALALAQTVAGIHHDSHALVMADCGSFDDAAAAVEAAAVVVGTAITHPATITGWFAEALK
ncbi:N-acetylmannosamine-6-phosphate 2-epimerase [Pseudarthrobacter sp. MDT3-1]